MIRNKFYLVLLAVVFGFTISYVVFGWEEPASTMPTDISPLLTATPTDQEISEQKFVTNFDADYLDGLDGSAYLAAESSVGNNYYLILANFAKNNTGLAFPTCPDGYSVATKDGFVQYQNQENVVGGIYDATYMNYYTRAVLNGVDIPLRFRVYKNTANGTCLHDGWQYFDYTNVSIAVSCIGDCASCSDAANIAMTYAVCAKDEE